MSTILVFTIHINRIRRFSLSARECSKEAFKFLNFRESSERSKWPLLRNRCRLPRVMLSCCSCWYPTIWAPHSPKRRHYRTVHMLPPPAVWRVEWLAEGLETRVVGVAVERSGRLVYQRSIPSNLVLAISQPGIFGWHKFLYLFTVVVVCSVMRSQMVLYRLRYLSYFFY